MKGTGAKGFVLVGAATASYPSFFLAADHAPFCALLAGYLGAKGFVLSESCRSIVK